VPLHETINICLSKLFVSATTTIIGLTRPIFKTFLEHSVLNSFFIFNDKLYKQIEGLGMGLPLGPTFANIFMCHHEVKWLEDCPIEFKPKLYQRYVDDTFLLFEHQSHADLFLNYLNTKHCNIKFTIEKEADGKISFLDSCITRINNKFTSSVYRKNTFTGLGISFFSFCTFRFKANAIKTLIFRAYKICSTFKSLDAEFQFLRNFFINNGFPSGLIYSYVNKFLRNKYEQPIIRTRVPTDFYVSLPYFGYHSEKLKTELSVLLSKFFPEKTFGIILVNNFKIGSLFNFKDKLPEGLQSSVVYEFSCARCASMYVGSTYRTLNTRIAEHAGRSYRTNNPIASPPSSNIRKHCQQDCDSPINKNQFKILTTATTQFDLRILESLYIYKLKPSLNDHQSAYPLCIVNR